MYAEPQPRILVVDDSRAVLDEFRKIVPQVTPPGEFELDTAHQGQEGVSRARSAQEEGRPYAVAFVDLHMPPGWNGLETIERLWQIDPALQIVICSSYPEYLWDEVRSRLGVRDDLLVIKKPFDRIEVVQCMHALSSKWRLARAAAAHVSGLEAELRLAHKLEAVGQLAAGVAHEINTPVQFIGDSLAFAREGLGGLLALVAGMRAAAADDPALTARFAALADDADLPYLDEQLPLALARMHDGVAQVGAIVRSMKELSHNGPRVRAPVDVVRSVHNALLVTASAHRYVADVVTDLAPVPPVVGYASELSQVLVNLIVNATHAIEDRRKLEPGRGTLTIRTRVEGAEVVVSVTDTGCGIPTEVQPRIFDPFYTTKEVGRGTGQGLAITSRIVVESHGGQLTFDTEVGVGTTFHVRLPVEG